MSTHQQPSDRNSPTSVTLAPFWKRLFAWIYDLLGALGIFILALVVGELLAFNIIMFGAGLEVAKQSG